MTTSPGVSVVEEFVEAKDRATLFLRSWRPAQVRAVMVAVHEPGSDGERYRCLAQTQATHGIATWAIDLRGCGRSPAPHGRIGSIDHYLPDVGVMVRRAMQHDPAAPVFMCGHGLGAAIACRYGVRNAEALDGIICEAIALDPPWVSAVLQRLPRLSGVFRLARTTLFASWGPGRPLGELSLPLLLLHGSEDRRASPSDSVRLHTHVRSTDKTLQLFEGYDHRLIDGPGHALVRDKIGQWIEAQLDSRSRRRRIGIEYINE